MAAAASKVASMMSANYPLRHGGERHLDQLAFIHYRDRQLRRASTCGNQRGEAGRGLGGAVHEHDVGHSPRLRRRGEPRPRVVFDITGLV